MVLRELGRKINSALSHLTKEPVIDDKVFEGILKEICAALLQSDVNVKLVQKLRQNIRKAVNIENKNVNVKKVIQKAVYDELCSLVDPGLEPVKPKKGQVNVVMFVGLQGAGKTTSCSKLACYYQRKGWKVGLVCADTFRAGAFDQLKQNAAKGSIPFYGSYTESNPVQIAAEGVAKFKKEKFEIVIVDTSGRHKQEAALFEEMKQIEVAVNPNLTIFVLDGTIGQAAESQATAFKDTVKVGAIIITKMDGHAKGGGAISAVAATKSPIVFIGVGEHLDDLEPFVANRFVGKMLGLGDLQGLMERAKDLNIEENDDMVKRMAKGQFSLRDLFEQFQMIMKMGPMTKLMGMFPGMSEDMMPQGSEDEIQKRFRKMLCIKDSMTSTELDSDGKMFVSQPTRVLRVCKGAGVLPDEFEMVFKWHKVMATTLKQFGGNKEMMNMMGMGRGSNTGRMNPSQMARMQQQLRANPQIAQMAQRMGLGNMNLEQMMQQLQGGGMPDLSSLGNLMGAFGRGNR